MIILMIKKQVDSYIEFLLGKISKKFLIGTSILDGKTTKYYWPKNYKQPIFYTTKDIEGKTLIIYLYGYHIFRNVSNMFSIPFNDAVTIVNDYFYQKILYDKT